MAVAEGSGRGRRRDPELDTRIHAAALDEYGRTGWAAFTMDGVARRAGVGKSSVYLRWSTKEELLADALTEYGWPLASVDTGSFVGDVTKLATSLMRHFLSSAGWATVRIAVDAVAESTAFDFLSRIRLPHQVGAARMVQRAIERGELVEGAPVIPFLEALYGGVLMHVLALPPAERERTRANVEEPVRVLVELCLTGAGITART